ncbi:MAG: sensor domain-containing diguanylate cyclase [Lachnospiraceae bacterium]|nr:sensor domain-containing diguanylate cyclase [Lachnospiraceae bacterium]
MKQTSSIPIRICLGVYFVLLLLFLIHAFSRADMLKFIRADDEAEKRDYANAWEMDSGESVDLTEISAKRYGGSFAVSKVLPLFMKETDAIYFSTSNLAFRVFVDGQLIYTYDTTENLTGTGDGISYHMIGLGIKDEGRTVRIEADAVFADGHGGRINDMQYGPEELYRYATVRRNLIGFDLSALMMLFGITILGFYFGLRRKNAMFRSLWALGLSVMLFGSWSLCDTGLPQLLSGVIGTSREIVYGILHLAGLPLVYFVNSRTKRNRPVYLYLSFLVTVLSCGWLVFSRYALGMDMHTQVLAIYLSYIAELAILVIMLIDNEMFCRKRGESSFMEYFYVGAGVFILCCFIDMGRYSIGRKSSVGHGSWFRLGLVIFFLFMGLQLILWWSEEKVSLERDRFINHLLQYIMGPVDPDSKIKKVLEYLCEELHADRAYIFEDMGDGTFDNTYEYCAPGVTPEINNLKGLPYKGTVDVWYEEYKKGGHVMIEDLEKYRSVSENMYRVLKPQGIRTLVTGPLVLEGEYIGFFGVDNPPVRMMEEVSEIIRLLMFFLSELVARRDYHKRLMDYSYQDALTGVGNRRAIREFEKKKLDTSRPYGFVMCDVNGLKSVNDHDGHDAGDALIVNVASCLAQIFGRDHVFRMGGDEFAVYAFDETAESFEARVSAFRSLIDKNGIHAAVGASYAAAGDADCSAHRLEADNRMYEEKRAYHATGA